MTRDDEEQSPSLYEEPFRFDFFQAVRLLQAHRGHRAEVGHDSAPTEEAIRFVARASLGFPASAIHDLRPGVGDLPPRMTVAFFGLTGPSGVLPSYFSEAVIEEGEGGALGAFLEIFDHRLISLFYRAWERNHPQQAGTSEARGRFTYYLLALAGRVLDPLLRPAQQDSLPYAGLYADRRRSATGLKGLLFDLLNGEDSPLGQSTEPIAVDIEQFIGHWLPLDPSTRPVLGRGSGEGLGPSAILGRRVRDHRSKIKVRLGPLGYQSFQALLPESSGDAFRRVVTAIREYIGPAFTFDLELQLRSDDVSPARLGSAATRLGRTWVVGRTGGQTRSLLIRTCLSGRRAKVGGSRGGPWSASDS